MPDRFDDIADVVGYRLAHAVARKLVETIQGSSWAFDLRVPKDLAGLHAMTVKGLGRFAATIPPEVLDEAIVDAIAGRKSRW